MTDHIPIAPSPATTSAHALTWREFNRLETLEWGEKHFGSLATGRTFRRPAMQRLVDRGLARSVGLVEMCDDDGFTVVPQRIGEGFVMTDAGREALAAWRAAHCPTCGHRAHPNGPCDEELGPHAGRTYCDCAPPASDAPAPPCEEPFVTKCATGGCIRPVFTKAGDLCKRCHQQTEAGAREVVEEVESVIASDRAQGIGYVSMLRSIQRVPHLLPAAASPAQEATPPRCNLAMRNGPCDRPLANGACPLHGTRAAPTPEASREPTRYDPTPESAWSIAPAREASAGVKLDFDRAAMRERILSDPDVDTEAGALLPVIEGGAGIDALICAECGAPLGEHFDMKGQRGLGAWCTTDPASLRHFRRAASPAQEARTGESVPLPPADRERFDALVATLPSRSPAQEATPPREEQHQGWTKNDQRQEPKPSRDATVCVRVSTADLAPLQIALAQAGRLGRWVCEDSLGFVEFDSQEEADEALVAAYLADCTEVTVAQADAAFRFAERHQARG